MRPLLLLACVGCHLGEATWMNPDAPAPAPVMAPAPAPAPPPKPRSHDDRVALAMTQSREDTAGRTAFAYVASKALKQKAPHASETIDQAITRMMQASETAPQGCKPIAIERAVLPTEPVLVKAAQVSQHVFATWLAAIDALWIVRAQCASGAALFVITGYKHGDDRVLVAHNAGDTVAPVSGWLD